MAADIPPISTGWTTSTSNPDPRPPRTPGVIIYPNFNFEPQGIARAPNAHNWKIDAKTDAPIPSSFLGPPFVHVLMNTFMNDASCQRKLMVTVHYFLTNPILSPQAPELKVLLQRDRRAVGKILRSIRRIPEHTLLLEATLKWCEARDSDDHAVLVASEKFANLGKIDWLAIPEQYPKEYAEMQRQFHGDSELLQTRSATRASNTAEMMNLAPGAYGLQLFSTRITEELNARGGWKEYTLHGTHTVQMPKKYLLTVKEQACWNCTNAHTRGDCNRDSLGCSRCKFEDEMCNYDYLDYVSTFQHDEVLKLTDVLKSVGHKKLKPNARTSSDSTEYIKRNRSDEDTDDDQRNSKKPKGSTNLKYVNRFKSSTSGSSQKHRSRNAGHDTDIPDFPNLKNDLSSKTTANNVKKPEKVGNLRQSAKGAAEQNNKDMMNCPKTPTRPTRSSPVLSKKTPSSIQKSKASNPVTPPRHTINLLTKGGKVSFSPSPPKTSPLTEPPSDSDMDNSFPSASKKTILTPVYRSPRVKKTGAEIEEVAEEFRGMKMSGGSIALNMNNGKISKIQKSSSAQNCIELENN